MRRLAIFVEGLTEQLFAERFLKEVTGEKGLSIEKRRASGGRKGTKRTLILLSAPAGASTPKFFALIVDCGSDNRVKSDIRDNYANLVSKGYKTIIGMRDAYPVAKRPADLPKLRKGLLYKLKSRPVEVAFVLAVMEIEAWFLSEHTHFQRIDRRLTVDRIRRAITFDPSRDDAQLRQCPSHDLDVIYKLVRLSYKKETAAITRTINALDFARIYLEFGNRFEDLKVLIEKIDKTLYRAA